MIKINNRLKAVASFVTKSNSVIDVGCDHGYLAIFLKVNNLCKNIIASDVSENALNSARENFDKYEVSINSYVSDGLISIDEFFDTVILSGMGTNTIVKIINNSAKPKKIILSSNNDHYELRKYMNKQGYKLKKEIVICERKKYYPVMCYVKGKEELDELDLKYGKSNNKDYFEYLKLKNSKIMKSVPFKKKLSLIYENHLLNKKINGSTGRM